MQRECSSCHLSIVSSLDANNSRYKLKPGENMFDFEGSTASTQHLSSFLHLLSASNVYRMFFAYTQVMQHDTHRCCTSYHKYGNQNRFSDIPCIEETRVHVKHATEDHDYIHANWVDGYREPKKFILTQAPLGQTVNQFWNMIWQEKCLVVVSMIQMFDINGAEWSIPYIPKKTGEERDAGNIKLIHCGTRKLDDTANRPCGPMADVEDVVMRIRTQRAMAVQKAEMYLFLHLAVFEYAVRQRYISEETYSEVDVGGFFYEPRQQDQEESGTESQSTSRTTGSSESHDRASKQSQQLEKQSTQKK
ncbi:Protein-tyrosine phosphatase [Ancylostoma caninum]|uniref:Protein-tyrosine phosphatase n=1 Tax=Ancylostoma caninum TaxID=29170 RepID=A0A368HCD7_ANCCA|nr:Protein-tyrosine phosphatase [Ancylostoma caninum]